MPNLYFNRFHIADYATLTPEQKAQVKSMIVTNITIRNRKAMERSLDLIHIFGDRTGLCLMDKGKPFGFIYATSAMYGPEGKILKLDYAVCPMSTSKKDFFKAGGARRIDPMLELAKGALLWGIEQECVMLVGATPVSAEGKQLLDRLTFNEFISSKSRMIVRDRFEPHWEQSGIDYKREKQERLKLKRKIKQLKAKGIEIFDEKLISGLNTDFDYVCCKGEPKKPTKLTVKVIKIEELIKDIGADPMFKGVLQKLMKKEPKLVKKLLATYYLAARSLKDPFRERHLLNSPKIFVKFRNISNNSKNRPRK